MCLCFDDGLDPDPDLTSDDARDSRFAPDPDGDLDPDPDLTSDDARDSGPDGGPDPDLASDPAFDPDPDVPFDPDDPEPDVLPGGGWLAHDLSLGGEDPAAAPTEALDRMLALAVARMLVTWRLDRGLRQRDVARRFGMSQPQLSRLERARIPVSFELLSEVAGVTGSTVAVTVRSSRAGRPVRRLVLDGELGAARVHLVVDGPSARSDAPGQRAPGGRRSGPIS